MKSTGRLGFHRSTCNSIAPLSNVSRIPFNASTSDELNMDKPVEIVFLKPIVCFAFF